MLIFQCVCVCVHVFVKDMDGDHRVSFKDFQEAIKLENLLLQGFGQCLPDDKVNKALCVWFLLRSSFNTAASYACICVVALLQLTKLYMYYIFADMI